MAEIEFFNEATTEKTEDRKRYLKKHSIEDKRRRKQKYFGKKTNPINKNIKRRKRRSQRYLLLKAKQILQRGRIIAIYKAILEKIIYILKYLYKKIS